MAFSRNIGGSGRTNKENNAQRSVAQGNSRLRALQQSLSAKTSRSGSGIFNPNGGAGSSTSVTPLTDAQVIDRLLGSEPVDLAALQRTNAKAPQLNQLLRLVNTNNDRNIADQEVLSALAALRDESSALNNLTDSIGLEALNHILNKNTNIDRGAVDQVGDNLDSNDDGAISPEEIFEKIRTTNFQGKFITGTERALLASDSRFVFLEQLFLNNDWGNGNGTFTNINNDANKSELDNAKQTFKTLLDARAAGVQDFVFDKLRSSVTDIFSATAPATGQLGKSNKHWFNAFLTNTFNLDNSGSVSKDQFIRGYVKSLSHYGGSESTVKTYLDAFNQAAGNPMTADEKTLIDSLSTKTGARIHIDDTKVAARINEIKSGTKPASDLRLIIKALEADSPTEETIDTLKALITPMTSTGNVSGQIGNENAGQIATRFLKEVNSYESSLAFIDDLKSKVAAMTSVDVNVRNARIASLDAFKASTLQPDFAMLFVARSLDQNSNRSSAEAIRINQALQGINLGASAAAIDSIRNAYPTNASTTNSLLTAFQGVPVSIGLQALSERFNALVPPTSSVEAKLSALNTLETINPDVSKLLRVALHFDANNNGVIDDTEVAKGLLNLSSLTGVGNTDVTRVLASNANSTHIAELLSSVNTDANGTISDRELINGILKQKVANDADGLVLTNILGTNSKRDSYALLINSLGFPAGKEFSENELFIAIIANAKVRAGTSSTLTLTATETGMLAALGRTSSVEQGRVSSAINNIRKPTGDTSSVFESGAKVKDTVLVFNLLNAAKGRQTLDSTTLGVFKLNGNLDKYRDITNRIAEGNSLNRNSFIKLMAFNSLASSHRLSLSNAELDLFDSSPNSQVLVPDLTLGSSSTLKAEKTAQKTGISNILAFLDPNKDGLINSDRLELANYYFNHPGAGSDAQIDFLGLRGSSTTLSSEQIQLNKMLFDAVKNVLNSNFLA